MDQKFIDSITMAWQEVSEKKKLDPVNPNALKGKHKDRADKDIDNDGDVDSSDQYLHKRRKAVSKAIQQDESSCGSDRKKYKTEEDDMDTDEPMAKDGMKKCKECGGSSENHDEECSHYASSEKSKATVTKEAIHHDVHGYGEVITETENGYDVLFAHGVEFNVPAEQCESMAPKQKYKAQKSKSANDSFKKMRNRLEDEEVKEDDDPCWDSHKQVGMKKKGGKMVPNCVPKEEVEHEEESLSEATIADVEVDVHETYSSIQQQAISAMRRMWEGAGAVADKKAKQGGKGQPADADDDNLKGKGAVDMAKDIDAEGPDSPKVPKGGDDEVGHDDASKAGRATKPAAHRPGDQKTGDKSIIKGGK